MKVFDRAAARIFQEEVYGDLFVRLAYTHPLGKKVVGNALFQKAVSHAIGFWQSRNFSKHAISDFIDHYQIKMDDFVLPERGFRSFNEFFIRELRMGARAFPAATAELGALAEGRLSVFAIEGAQTRLCIKGKSLSVAELLGSAADAHAFAWGHAFVFRLCPVDYHRFHFPDSGLAGAARRLGNRLHSVNPLAQKVVPELFLWNERQLTPFHSDHFGPLMILEVGAMGVGKICQTFRPNMSVPRGAEKGYFSFGASTVILLTQRAHVEPDKDLIERSEQGLESLVRLGEKIARAVH